MKNLIRKIESQTEEPTFQSLKRFIKSIDLTSLKFKNHIPEPKTIGDYGRNILTLNPFECVLINWPPGVESGIHHHKGLFGYVLVLEGELDNVCYKEDSGKLVEFTIDKFGETGLMPEPNGVIHKLKNNSNSNRAITLHFYYPAITSFEGMRIFNTEKCEIGILSAEAETASWSEKSDHFKEIKKNAFTYISNQEYNKDKSHIISNVIPKPHYLRINDMNASYFSEQATQYDFSDFNQPNRKSYIDTIDRLIGEDLKKDCKTNKHLDIATGTGRRALNIKSISGLDYELVGVDISEEMCKIAESRGIRTFHQAWANNDEHTGEMFDSATFLYAFGHIATRNLRIKTLHKINSYLNSGATFYFDLFSIENENEWGPLALEFFHTHQLEKHGYQEGDVFYKKTGLNELAFIHYFSKKEIISLLNSTGFEVEWIKNIGYARNPGEIVTNEKKGNFFIKAKKGG